MAWISELPDDEALLPEVADLFEAHRDADTGVVDSIMSVHSLHPAGLAAHNELYRAVMSGTRTLRKVERELIALVVSLENECHY